MSETYPQWLEREYAYAAQAMQRSISPVDMVKTRPGFGQSIGAVKGAIVASPVLGAYDPDPDYFFHWYRDSAVVIDALRLLFEDGSVGAEALAHLRDFVAFNLALQKLDGRERAAARSWRAGVAEDYVKYLRDDLELAAVHGDAVAAETRVNPDGTLDISKWPRPQNDGPPLTALALLRWTRSTTLDAAVRADVAALIRSQLDLSLRHWRKPCFDIWEEELGRHYYSLRVAAAALGEGADWLAAQGDDDRAQTCRSEAATILGALDDYWLADAGYYRSRMLDDGRRSAKALDIAVILAANHAGAKAGAHSVEDPRQQATLTRLDALFDASYAINRRRGVDRAPAMGRYAGDIYYSGGAYYFSTLGAAEFCFRAAQVAGDAAAWIARGDAYLMTVRDYTPPSGELSEQFDQHSGAQTSARHLAWSYAAFISCVTARRLVIADAGARDGS